MRLAGRWTERYIMMRALHDIATHKERFTAYYCTFADRFAPGGEHAEHLHLKWEHSLRVTDNAEAILAAPDLPENFTPELVRAAQLAALYHDVARFEQYVAYYTFRDAESANHGAWGSKLLKREAFLSGESPRTASLVRAGAAMHNRFAIPAGVPQDYRLVTQVVRDADKIDILRVISEYVRPGGKRSQVVTWKLVDVPEAWTPSLFDAVLEGRLGISKDMRYLNDFRLLLCSWVYDLNFLASRALVRKQGHMEQILAGLPQGAAMDKVRDKVTEAISNQLWLQNQAFGVHCVNGKKVSSP